MCLRAYDITKGEKPDWGKEKVWRTILTISSEAGYMKFHFLEEVYT